MYLINHINVSFIMLQHNREYPVLPQRYDVGYMGYVQWGVQEEPAFKNSLQNCTCKNDDRSKNKRTCTCDVVYKT